MATTGITNDYFLASTQKPKISENGNNSSLGKDAFLKILITQLQNQDPTQPMDDKEFISQMAQFSSLEQMQNMTTAMEKLLTSQTQTQLMSYTTFVGKEVKWTELTEKLDNNGQPIIAKGTGAIDELKFVDGEPVFVLKDGKEIKPANITSILNNGSAVSASAKSENPFAAASQLIGQTVQYDSNGEMLQAIIEAVSTNNSAIEYILNDANKTRLKEGQFEAMSK
ncbi:flagellar hook assembly protein FlgD [Lysinibacillus yapensis]|uniref:Basal-body rod modification protein FlgD n=1 Tax=Ureibacillus yapensis TaxID=2304605 RepID=A0A396SEU9_9BACL|nr:flagellar hook assembly protein FlgD [Lysinibacillus yapensis]RHW39642.1 flagellar hook assembly protein FlgD [Lysinibacillus yapensis]